MNAPAGPGWYPDPRKPAQDRYWDGEQWTGQTRKRKGTGFMGTIRGLPTWVKVVIPIAALLIVIGAVAGDEESDDNGGPDGEPTAAATQSEPEGRGSEADEGNNPAENASDENTPSVGPNGSVEVDTLRWRLDDAEATRTIGDQTYGLGAKANGVYVVAELNVTNNKSESVTLTSEVVSLVAGDNTYEADSSAETALVGAGTKTFLLEDLGPDVSLTGKVAFDVAPPVLKSNPRLRFNELGFGDSHGYIALPLLRG